MIISQLDEQPFLIQAIFSGDIQQAKHILDNDKVLKQDVNDLDAEKRSPLHAASFKGDAQIASLLLKYGARVNAKDNKWLTPLHVACHVGSEETVSALLNHQGDTSARDKLWQTPLHVAASSGAVECISQLLDHVPNINVTDRSGRTALHHAALNRYDDVVELLLSKGSIVNACDKKDCRPLHWAAHMGHVNIMELLLRHGADVHACDRNQYTPLHVVSASGMVSACRLLLHHNAMVDVQNSYGNTPLHIACLNGHFTICEELCASGADCESVNYCGQTPLHIAAASIQSVDCLNFLLDQKVDINKQSNDGKTPLHMSAIHGRFSKSKILIDKGAIIDATDKNGCTALHIAAQYGHELLSNTLLNYGANPSKRGYEGRTPLHMCCLSGYVECCRKFLQAGVDLNVQDNTAETPLHYAAYKGSIECLDLLVSKGANFQMPDDIGKTPLHYAAAFGHYNCVMTLVGIGSNVNLIDNDGCTALHLASGYDLEGRCIEYLLQHKANPVLKDKKGYCPIHYAVNGNNQRAVEYLLKALGSQYKFYGGDSPNTTPLHIAAKNGNEDILRLVLPHFNDANIKDDNGCTSLLLAAREGHTHCVQTLLRYGAKVSICDNLYNMSPIHHSAKNGHQHCLALLVDNAEHKTAIDMPDNLHRTALMLAVSSGHGDCVVTLLKSGADRNVADDELHSSIFRAVVTGQNNIAQLLITKGANIETSDVHGKTVLHLAAACGHFACLETILNHMSDKYASRLDNQNCTALHWAAYNGNQTCVEYLLKKNIFKKVTGNPFSPSHCASLSGYDKCLELLCNYYGANIVNLKDSRNRTPLHIASLRGHADCVKYILKQGAEINCQDNEGRTPLLSAAFNGQTQVMEILIGKSADITSYDKNGNTSLHLACLKKHNHAGLLLLEYIDDPNIINMINNDRRTPLHLSARNGLFDVTKQLISKGASVEAVDSNGLTPALSCAPNVNVARCLAIILANYPKQTNYESTFLEKESHALKNIPKTKSKILNDYPHTITRLSLKDTLNKDVEPTDLTLSRGNDVKETDRCSEKINDESLMSSYIMIPKVYEKDIKKCQRMKMDSCFIVENCFENRSRKLPRVNENCGMDLHRSSTTTSFTNTELYSKFDYNEMICRNTNRKGEEDLVTEQLSAVKKFHRTSQYTSHKNYNNNINKYANIKRKIEHDVYPNTSKALKSSFDVLFDRENYDNEDELKIVESYSNEDICKIDHLLRAGVSSVTTSNATTNKQKELYNNVREKLKKQKVLSKTISNKSLEEVIKVVNIDVNEDVSLKRMAKRDITLNVCDNHISLRKRNSNRSHEKQDKETILIKNVYDKPLDEVINIVNVPIQRREKNPVCCSFINNYVPAQESNENRNNSKNDANNNEVNKHDDDRNETDNASPLLDLNDLLQSPNIINLLNFNAGTNCMEKKYMYMKITNLQANIKKLCLGEKSDRIPPLYSNKNIDNIDNLIHNESIFDVTQNRKCDIVKEESSNSCMNNVKTIVEVFAQEVEKKIGTETEEFVAQDVSTRSFESNVYVNKENNKINSTNTEELTDSTKTSTENVKAILEEITEQVYNNHDFCTRGIREEIVLDPPKCFLENVADDVCVDKRSIDSKENNVTNVEENGNEGEDFIKNLLEDVIAMVQQIKRNFELDVLNDLDDLSILDNVNQINHLDHLNRLEHLNQLDHLSQFDDINQLDDLNELNRLNGLDDLKELDRLKNLDREMKVIYENEVEAVKSTLCICVDPNEKLIDEKCSRQFKRKKSQKLKNKSKSDVIKLDDGIGEKPKRKSREFCAIT